MRLIKIRKLDHAGKEVISYPGRVLRRDSRSIVLRTEWDRDPLDLDFVVLEPGDRWTEYFYTDRWYNIFQICASGGRLKGWYCNITRPAHIGPDDVSAEDLALDLWVAPDGKALVLDEHEFVALPLSAVERQAAERALAELQTMVTHKAGPFDRIQDNG